MLMTGSHVSCISSDTIINTLGRKLDTLELPDGELRIIDQRLDAIVSRMEILMEMVQNLNIEQIVSTNENLPIQFNNPDLLKNTRDLKSGAKAVISTASSVAQGDSTVWGGSDTRSPLTSEYGDTLNDLNGIGIKQWTFLSWVDKDYPAEAFACPDAKATGFTSADFGADGDTEAYLVDEILARGQVEFAENRHDTAIECLSSGLRRSANLSNEHKLALDLNSIELMLAFSYMHKEQLPKAERLFRKLARSLSDDRDWIRIGHACWGLAQIRLYQHAFDDAELWCQKMLSRSRQLCGKGYALYINALELMELIHELKGDLATAAAFAYLAAKACTTVCVQSKSEWPDCDPYRLRDFIKRLRTCKWFAETLLSRMGFDPCTQTLSANNGKLAGEALLSLVRAQPGQDLTSDSRHTWTAQYLLDRGASANVKDLVHGNSALLYASYQGHFGIVRLLCERGASIRQANKLGDTPLIAACRKGHTAIVKLLCRYSADANEGIPCTDVTGKTIWIAVPIEEAAFHGHTSVVELLLQMGVDLEARNTINDYTALLAAASQGHESTLRCLLGAGAGINARSAKGFTALHKVAGFNSEALFSALLAKGSSLEARTKEGSTALIIAAKRDNALGIEILLDAGADIEGQDKQKRTALSWSVIANATAAMQALLAHSASTKIPLYLACSRGYVAPSKLLLAAGADPNEKCDGSHPYLTITAQHGFNEIVILLIEYGAFLETQSSTSNPALFTAAIHGQIAIAEILLSAGANPDGRDAHGMTAVMAIVGKNRTRHRSDRRRVEMLSLLCESGANVCLNDRSGKTALYRASKDRSADRGAIIRILRNYGAV